MAVSSKCMLDKHMKDQDRVGASEQATLLPDPTAGFCAVSHSNLRNAVRQVDIILEAS